MSISTKTRPPFIVWVRLAAMGAFIVSTIYSVWLGGWVGFIVPAALAIAFAIGAITFGILFFAIGMVYEAIRRLLRKGR
jgi:hypothetical protein